MDGVTTEKLNRILKSADSLESFLQQSETMRLDMTLSEYFSYLFASRQAKKSDIIRATLLDQNYAYQLFNGIKKNPSKDVLMQLAFAFPLTVKETQILLYLGNAPKLYVKNKRDAILLYGLEHHFTLSVVNELLEDIGEKVLE